MITKNFYFFIQTVLVIYLITVYSFFINKGINFLNGYIYITFLLFSFLCILITGIFNFKSTDLKNIVFFPFVFLIITIIFELILISIAFISNNRLFIYLVYAIYFIFILLDHFKKISSNKAFYGIFLTGFLTIIVQVIFHSNYFRSVENIIIIIVSISLFIKLISFLLLKGQKKAKKLFSLFYIYDWILLLFLVFVLHFMMIIMA